MEWEDNKKKQKKGYGRSFAHKICNGYRVFTSPTQVMSCSLEATFGYFWEDLTLTFPIPVWGVFSPIIGESGWTSTGGPTVGVAVAVMRLVNSGSNHPRKKRVNCRSSSQVRMLFLMLTTKKTIRQSISQTKWHLSNLCFWAYLTVYCWSLG